MKSYLRTPKIKAIHHVTKDGERMKQPECNNIAGFKAAVRVAFKCVNNSFKYGYGEFNVVKTPKP